MATVREGARMASSLGRRQFPIRAAPLCARRYASTGAEKSSSDLADLDNASSFATGTPDQADIEAFNAREKASETGKKLPGNRFVAQWLYMIEYTLNILQIPVPSSQVLPWTPPSCPSSQVFRPDCPRLRPRSIQFPSVKTHIRNHDCPRSDYYDLPAHPTRHRSTRFQQG